MADKPRGEHEMVKEHMRCSKLIRELLEEAAACAKGPKRRRLLRKAEEKMRELMALEEEVKAGRR